jgi:hypothetical protein
MYDRMFGSMMKINRDDGSTYILLLVANITSLGSILTNIGFESGFIE